MNKKFSGHKLFSTGWEFLALCLPLPRPFWNCGFRLLSMWAYSWVHICTSLILNTRRDSCQTQIDNLLYRADFSRLLFWRGVLSIRRCYRSFKFDHKSSVKEREFLTMCNFCSQITHESLARPSPIVYVISQLLTVTLCQLSHNYYPFRNYELWYS